jgi:hypothetical protein
MRSTFSRERSRSNIPVLLVFLLWMHQAIND